VIVNRNNFLEEYIFRENNLYAFMLNELADIDWDRNFTDMNLCKVIYSGKGIQNPLISNIMMADNKDDAQEAFNGEITGLKISLKDTGPYLFKVTASSTIVLFACK
jgi:hypothetical protein